MVKMNLIMLNEPRKEKRHLEKSLATSAAIWAELKKKKQNKMEEQ
ncbi:hypothetical protein HID58_071366 [Brassica napus]|uniref:Uncharacterized protein n=1 Tax=Brassica napus TaxID=3708 RepID=A0ABQ7Z1E7_BRANA|nr:hypothetical protein HID58_071366 [Brassica napus]